MAAGAKKDLNNSHPASPASGGSGGEDAGVAASASSPGSASAAAAVSAAHEILSASADDYFPAGCTVTCKTCAGKVLEGEVMAFDPATRILIMSKLPVDKTSVTIVETAFVFLYRDTFYQQAPLYSRRALR